ncbi:uncharacterized protein MYCFIDRAFT_104018, partial [Pseudocercospora fijiensis CIRAD86]
PSPAAGKQTGTPKTPTKLSRKPAQTPQRPAQTSESKPVPSTPKAAQPEKPETDSPKLPPRPDVAGKTEEVTGEAESMADDVQSKAGQAQSSAGDDDEDDGPLSKVTQAGQKGQEGLQQQAPEPVQDDDDDDDEEEADTISGAQQQTKDFSSDAGDEAEDVADDATEKAGDTQPQGKKGNGLLSGAKGLAGKAQGLAGKASQDPKAAAQQAGDDAKEAVDGAKETAEDAQDQAGEAVGGAKATADGVKDQAGEAVGGAKATADGVKDQAGEAVDGAKETAEDAQDQAEDTVNGVKDDLPVPEGLPVDLSVLRGLEVDEEGLAYDKEGNPIGRLAEGDAEDLAGYPIGDDGEILDDDGDLVGRVELLPDEIKLEEEVDEAAANLPSTSILKGLTCQIDGLIYDADGNTVGRVIDGDPQELQNATLNDQGEFIDKDGNVVGHAEIHEDAEELVQQGIYKPAEQAQQVAEDAQEQVHGVKEGAEDVAGQVEESPPEIEDQLPGIEALQGKELNEAGEIVDEEGIVLGNVADEDLKKKIEEGEIQPETLKVDEEGNLVDGEGNILGKTELAEGAAEKLAGLTKLLDMRILDGKRINKKGTILDDDGEEIGELTDGELSDCAGARANDKGEVFNKKGELVGHVRVVPGEAAENATRELLEELGELEDQAEEQIEDAQDQAVEVAEPLMEEPELNILDGLKVNKKGKVLNEDGEEIGELTAGDLSKCAGKKINAVGEVIDKDGNVVGHVRTLPQEVQQEVEAPAVSILEGLKVNKKGQVLNEDGEPIGELTSGDLAQVAGKKIDAKGQVLDDQGNVLGTVRTLPIGDQEEQQEEPQEEESAQEEEEGDQLPPLSILEGLKVNKSGKLIDGNGAVVGELVEGDPKKLSKSGATCDAEGQFWDNKGHVIGRAQTLPQEEPEEEAPFAGLEGLRVVEEGWVQDENGNTVGYVTEGEASKLIGRVVDEDGDIIDKKGSVVGHAERYVPEEQEEVLEEAPDLSFLEGKTVTKAGLVIGDEGIPVARLVEGSAKELTGKPLDKVGQFWNDKGAVIGKVELIPESEREAKPEGPFAGLDDLRVIEGGKIADEDGNVVGEIVEGNPKRLVGLSVDEDGDIVDKYGNVKGHAEPLPEEEPLDYTILDGLTLNKSGFVVDENGIPFGKIVEGNASELAGRQCDEQGYLHNDRGKPVGRCEPIPENERVARAEGPFAGLEGLHVVKDGKVEDGNGNVVGEITEGDAKRLVGMKVDEDGDIIDKFGNTKGHAEPLVEEEEQPLDNSALEGKYLNKQGYVVDDKGIPFGRLVEGNVSELAGRKCDENGFIYGDTGKVVGKCEILPENERVARPEGPFAGLEGLRVVKDGFVEDQDGNRVGQIVEGEPKRLVGLHVDEDGDIIDKYGNVKGHAEPWTEEEVEEKDLSILANTTINKSGYAVDGSGQIIGQVVEGDVGTLVGKKVDGKGQIWDNSGNVIGKADTITGVNAEEGPFAGFDGLQINKDGTVTTPAGDIIGRVIEGDIKKLLGHTVDEDGDILDKNGNKIGKAERWEPEEKERRVNPMSGKRVNKDGEVRDENGDLMGKLTMGDLGHCVGQEIDDAGNVVDVEGNKIGEVTLIENIAEDEYEGPTEDELEEARKREEERQIAEKMCGITQQTLERMQPICKQIKEHMEKADNTPKDELDEEELVNNVKPLIEEGGRILQECNGSLRGLDPDGKIAAQAKGRAGTGEATPEEFRLAETLKELTTTVVTTIDDAKKKLNNMPHAKKKLNPLWSLMTQPLFQILAAVGLLLAGVLGLVGQLLNGLGLGGLVNGLLGGLGINKLLASFGLIDEDKSKKKKKGGGNKLSSLPIVGGLLGSK